MCSRKVNFFNLKFNIKVILLFLNFLSLDLFSQTTFTVTLNTPGSSSWIVPCGVTSITVQCWGGGGAGGSANANSTTGGGGGGGGYSATNNIVVTAGSSISYTVGAGGLPSSGASGGNGEITTFSSVIANGGTGGGYANTQTSNGGAGASTTGASGGTVTAGSNGTGGAKSTGLFVGGNGGNAGGTGGGTGGAGGVQNAGVNGSAPGGGGGGSGVDNNAGGLASLGGAGGNGQITITYQVPFTVNAGADINLATCTTTNVTFAASALSPGTTGTWSTGSANISITNPTQTNASASGTGFTEGSSTSFVWTVSNGACTYQDEMVVNVPICAQNNPTCATAYSLTINSPLRCGQSTNLTTGDATDGCVISGTGKTVWYSFTVPAATTSLVLNVLGTSTTLPHFGLYGSCPTSCSQSISYTLNSGDPGKHILLSSLTAGATYFVQVQSGSSTLNSQFCISVNNVANNSIAPANALLIDDCGVTYNGTTNGGYYPSGTSTGSNNLDGATTTATGASETGDDVSFVVNNISWFKFCSVNAGTYNVQFDVVSCVFTGTSSGSQMAILRGTDNSMTNIWQATNPTQPATPIQTSPSFTLAANGCAYLVVMFNAPSDNSKDNFTVDNKLFGF
jgi:hypothetical protein